VFKNILDSDFIFLQLADDNFNIFPKEIGVVSEPQLFFNLRYLFLGL